MKWYAVLFLLLLNGYIQIRACYSEQEYETFKHIMFIGDAIWKIIKEKESKCNFYNQSLAQAIDDMQEALAEKDFRSYCERISKARSQLRQLIKVTDRLISDQQLCNLAFAKFTILQIEDAREYWPNFNTAQGMRSGFFLVFKGNLPINLCTQWGNLPIVRSRIDDPDITLNMKNKILELFSAGDSVAQYFDITVYVLRRIVPRSLFLSKAELSDGKVPVDNDFFAKWEAMQAKYNQEFNIQPPIYPRRSSNGPTDRKERAMESTSVLSLMHLATPKPSRKVSPILLSEYYNYTNQPHVLSYPCLIGKNS